MKISLAIGVAIGLHLVGRLGYVVGVGIALARQDSAQVFTRYDGIRSGFDRFRRGASRVMAFDAITFVLLALLTRETLLVDVSRAGLLVGGALLAAVAVSVKLWARARIGHDAYYWYNFFTGQDEGPLDPPGPYRYLRNPMYTVGYLHAYGLALALASLPALIAAVFDQIAILAFNRVVEKPHYQRMVAARDAGDGEAGA